MDEALTVRQVTLDGFTSSVPSSDAAAVSVIVDQNKWSGGQPHLAFVKPHRELFERTSLPFSRNLSANVLDNGRPEWCIWMN